ncbi:MAG: leucine-rich repeat protein [Oscillospiraceae bacterium]|nr:leucine-rich repeat protein [Oscillospiraceae bacterium]
MSFWEKLFGKKKKDQSASSDTEGRQSGLLNQSEPVYQPAPPKPAIEDYDHAEFEIRGTVLVKHNRQPKRPTIVIPNGVTEIGKQAIDGRAKIKSLTIPASVKVVRSYAIYQSVSPFKEIIAQGPNTLFEPNSFSLSYGGCIYAIEGSATWNSLVSNKGQYDFYDIRPYYPESAEKENSYFVMGKNGIQKAPKVKLPKQVIIPNAIDGKKILKVQMIKGLEEVEELEFSEGIESVSEFSGCPKLKKIVFPSTLKKIEWRSFSDCTELEEVVLNEGLETIGLGCFNNCTSLKKMAIPSTLTDISFVSSFDGTPWKDTLPDPWIHKGVLMRYLNSPEEYIVPSEVRAIGTSAFHTNKTIRSIRLHKNVERIQNYAFNDSALESIDFAGNCPIIGRDAFERCENLKKVAIPAGTKEIPDSCFSGCTSLADVMLPAGLEKIGWHAFQNCVCLNEIHIPSSVNLIGQEAFLGTALKDITIPEGERGWYKPEVIFPASTNVWKGSKLIQRAKTVTDTDGADATGSGGSSARNKEYRLSDSLILSLERGYYYEEQKTEKSEENGEGGSEFIAGGTVCQGRYKDADSGETRYKNDVIFKVFEAGEGADIEHVGIVPGAYYSGSSDDVKFNYTDTSLTLFGVKITTYIIEFVKKLNNSCYLDMINTITVNGNDEADKTITDALDYMLKVIPMFRDNGKPVEIEKISGKKLWKELQKKNDASKSGKKKAKKSAVSSGTASTGLTYSGNIVRLNRELSVEIPDGMVCSTDKNEIGSRKLISFYKDEKNDYYFNVHGEENYDINGPYGAPESFTIQEGVSVNGRMDLSQKKTREAIKQLIEDTYGFLVNGELVTLKENDNIMLCYKNDQNQTQTFIVTPEMIYSGQIWINDTDHAIPYVESFLSHVRSNEEENIEAEEQPDFVLPTYDEGKTNSAGGLIVPVPDQLLSLADAKKAEMGRVAEKAEKGEFGDLADTMLEASEMSYSADEAKFLFLAISKDRNRGFDNYVDAYCSINIRKDSLEQNEALSKLWGRGKEAERRDQLREWIHTNISEDHVIHYKSLGEKLEAAYTQANDGEDHGDYWCSYFAVILHDDTVYQVNMFFNAKENQALFEKTMDEWISRVRAGETEKVGSMMEEIRKAELGPYAGANGKINAVEASRLFSQDVLFFNDEDLSFDGKHHKAVSLQLNAAEMDNHPLIKENYQRIGNEVMDLLKYVEQNDKLIISKNRIHEDLLPMTRNDPATGITFMDFCAWHLLLFAVENEDEHKYMCTVEPNLIKGIPNAYDHVAEFLKTLLAYNGYTGDFTLRAILTISADLIGNRINDPVAGADEPKSLKTIEVKGDN